MRNSKINPYSIETFDPHAKNLGYQILSATGASEKWPKYNFYFFFFFAIYGSPKNKSP